MQLSARNRAESLLGRTRTWAGLAVPAAVETPAHAVTETATKTRMHKAGASEPRMEEARLTKAEASEVWTEKAAAEPAFPASAKFDGNSDRPPRSDTRLSLLFSRVLLRV